MLKQSNAAEAKPGFVQRAMTYLQEVQVELGKVTWPTKEDLKVSTKVTMMMLCIMAGIIFAYDIFFGQVVVWLLNLAFF